MFTPADYGHNCVNVLRVLIENRDRIGNAIHQLKFLRIAQRKNRDFHDRVMITQDRTIPFPISFDLYPSGIGMFELISIRQSIFSRQAPFGIDYDQAGSIKHFLAWVLVSNCNDKFGRDRRFPIVFVFLLLTGVVYEQDPDLCEISGVVHSKARTIRFNSLPQWSSETGFQLRRSFANAGR